MEGAAIGAVVSIALRASDRRHEEHDPLRQLVDNNNNLADQLGLLHVELEQNDFTMKDAKWETLKDIARRFKKEGQHLLKDYDDVRKRPPVFRGSTRLADLSKNMKEKADSIASHRVKMTTYEEKLIRAQRRSSEEMDKLPWVKKSVDHIWKHLGKRNIKKVGVLAAEVHETTTIMNSLHDKAVKEFERVMFVDSEDMGSEFDDKIGEAILRQLGKSVPSNRVQIRSDISKELQDKKYLLLLNRVPRKIDLEKLGILNIHMEGKVVAATKDEVVYHEMGQHDYELVGSVDESWKLFREIVGKIADDQKIRPLAQRIVEECGKNKLLIRAIGMCLKDMENETRNKANQKSEEEIKKDIRSIWQKCKSELQSDNHPLVEDFDDGWKVFDFICKKLSDSRKKCLLYRALFPQDARINADFLIECWGVERFIPQDEGIRVPIFKRTRVAGYKELQCLENAYLLETSAESKHVMMPSLFRRWALRMDYGLDMLVRFTEEDRGGYPEPENRGSKKRISLRFNGDLKALIKGVNPKGILSLFLHSNPTAIKKILCSIFVGGSQVQILYLGDTGIKSLPDSISKLSALKALYLNGCGNLRQLPSKIKKLKNLEILDVSGTGIPYLPAEIGDLSGLKCLRVSFNTPRPTSSGLPSWWKNQSRFLTRNIISRLSLLEELAISVSEESRDSWVAFIGDVIKDIANLEVLTNLNLHFSSVNHLADFIEKSKSWREKDISGKNAFRAFRLIVGSFEGDHDKNKNKDTDIAEHKAERHFQVFASQISPSELAIHSSSAIQDVLMQSTTFELIGDQGIDHLSSFGIDTIANLKVCIIRSCDNMESIISNNHRTADAALPHLEVLQLFNLCSLGSIYGAGLLGGSSFANLTTLMVVSCDALRAIMPFELTQNVTNLKHLRVKDCPNVAAIIALDEAVSNTTSSQVQVATDAADENPTEETSTVLPPVTGERLRNRVSRRFREIIEEPSEDLTTTLEAGETSNNFLLNGERLHNLDGSRFAEIIEEPTEDPTTTLEAGETSTNHQPNAERMHNRAGGQFGEITEEPTEGQAVSPPKRFRNPTGGQVAHHAADQNRSILLGKLKTLTLENLENLQTISHDVSLRWPSLQGLTIVQCDKLNSLPLSTENIEKLKFITCHNDWWEKVELVAAAAGDQKVNKAEFSPKFVQRHVELQ